MVQLKIKIIYSTLGAETFAGRKFRKKKKSRNYGHKLSRMTAFPANFATKTFAIEKKNAFLREITFPTEERLEGKHNFLFIFSTPLSR